MTREFPYSENAIRELQASKESKQKRGVPILYEIRVDFEKIINRTGDLTLFDSYKEFLFPQTEVVEFLFYIGNSNRYDKYVFIRKFQSNQQKEYEVRLAQEMQKLKVDFEIRELHKNLEYSKEKNKELKKRIKEYVKRISELESKNGHSAMLTNLLSAVKPNNSTSANSTDKIVKESLLQGIDNDELLKLLYDIKTNIKEDKFQEFLGVVMTLGQNPEIIPTIKQKVQKALKQTKDEK